MDLRIYATETRKEFVMTHKNRVSPKIMRAVPFKTVFIKLVYYIYLV